MSVDSSDCDDYAPPPPQPSKVPFTDLLAKFDEARDEMLQGQAVEADFTQFSKEKVQEYINLVLCGIGVDGTEYDLCAPKDSPEAYENAHCVPHINSAFIFAKVHFPWKNTFKVYTSYSYQKCHRGSLYVHLDFMVCL